MRIEKLKCLLDIAQTGSISATAQRLYISQQAVSKNIKHLEEELGVEVLIRSKTGVYLTEAGNLVVQFAKKVLAEEEVLQQKLNLLKAETKEKDIHIEISATSSVTKMVLPEVLAKINAKGLNVSVNLLQLNDFDSIVQRVLSGESTLGLMSINEQELMLRFATLKDELEWVTFVRDEIVVVVDNRYYLHNNLAIENRLENEAHIKTVYNIVPIKGMRQVVYDMNIICSNDADFHRSMMEQTGSITFMSGLDRHYYFNNKRYLVLRLDYDMPNIVHGVLYRKDAPLGVKNFILSLQKAMQNLQYK